MKRLIYIIAFMTGLGFMFSCEKELDNPVLDFEQIEAPVMNLPSGGEAYLQADGAYLLTPEYADSLFMEFHWEEMSYPLKEIANPVYSLEVSFAGQDFETIRTVFSTQEVAAEIQVERLNNSLAGLQAPIDEATEFEFRIRGIVSGSNVNQQLAAYSNSITLTIIPYEPPVFILNVPGNYQGWNPEGPPYLWSSDDIAFSGYIYLTEDNNEYKFAKGGWGDDEHWSHAGPGTIVQGGGPNFTQPGAGSYWFTVNLERLTYSIELRNWGIHVIGSTDEDIPLVYDPDLQENFSSRLFATLDLDAGTEFVFRANNNEDITIGNVDPPDGENAMHGGGSITIDEAGNYTIILDLTPMVFQYEIIKN